MSPDPRFRVSPHILEPLGLEQLQDPGLAVLELIKNFWDADSPEVSVVVAGQRSDGSIEVSDSGTGMSREEFEAHWLVLGDTHKRRSVVTAKGRPVIGEKGLGRLASFALGSKLQITSRREGHAAFVADVDWGEIMRASSFDAVPVRVRNAERKVGTSVVIGSLKRPWTEKDSELLVRHVEFLALPARQDRFVVHLHNNGNSQTIYARPDVLEQFAEAELEVVIGDDGSPSLTKALVGETSYCEVAYRPLPARDLDPRLAGAVNPPSVF